MNKTDAKLLHFLLLVLVLFIFLKMSPGTTLLSAALIYVLQRGSDRNRG